jgi:3-phosphoglycerate kinase
MQIRSIRNLKPADLAGKLVFLRSDFNVPIKNGKIIEDYKITTALPTINFLLKAGARVVTATHLGDPGGKKAKALSVEPIAKHLDKLLKFPVTFEDSVTSNGLEKLKKALKPGELLVIENLRFDAGEEKNDSKFAKDLAKQVEIYVNNAFAVSHRAHASVSAIKKFAPSYAGLLLEQEVESLDKALHPKKPLVVIIGGAKIKTKLPIIEKFLPVADHILVGGGIANDFIKQLGFEVGHSLVSDDEKNAKKLQKLYKKFGNSKILLPVDFVVASDQLGKKKVRVAKIDDVRESEYIFDLGPETIRFYAHHLKKAETLVWNGPLGWFEHKDFKHATMAIAQVFAARSGGRAFGVAGGGETVEALKMTKQFDEVDWVSTAGGAMLEYLSGAKLPGLEKIVK